MFVSRTPTGQPEIFTSIQGEGPTSGLPSVFVRLSMCNLRCSWCFVPETPILLADWTWRPLSEIALGDRLLAVGRAETRGSHARLAETTVEHIHTREAATVVVNGGLRCTPDHKFWLTGKDREGRSSVHSGWREIERAVGHRALFTTEPTQLDDSLYQRGWLAGMADGDGCFWTLKFRRGYRRFRLALNDNLLLERARVFAAGAGFVLRRGQHSHTGFSGQRALQACLWLTTDHEARTFESWVDQDVDSAAWRAGYLGGILDAEGSFSTGVLRIAQSPVANSETCARIERVLQGLRLGHTNEQHGYYLHRAGGEAWRVLSMARPGRKTLLEGALGHHPHASRVVEDVSPTGRSEPVVTLTTTAGSYIAGGYIVKNCDTKYTWDWEHYDPKAEIVDLEVSDVTRRVIDGAGQTVRNVVITGGEPLLQQRLVSELATRLVAEGLRVEVETNGTILPEPQLAAVVEQWNVSPKLASSGNAPRSAAAEEALTWFATQTNAYLKFVIVEPADVEEVVALVQRLGFPPERVFLMPEGTDAATITERSGWLVASAQRTGFRLGARLHVLLWGATRGR